MGIFLFSKHAWWQAAFLITSMIDFNENGRFSECSGDGYSSLWSCCWLTSLITDSFEDLASLKTSAIGNFISLIMLVIDFIESDRLSERTGNRPQWRLPFISTNTLVIYFTEDCCLSLETCWWWTSTRMIFYPSERINDWPHRELLFISPIMWIILNEDFFLSNTLTMVVSLKIQTVDFIKDGC